DQLAKKWTACVYVFFKPVLTIFEDDNGRYAHVFKCTNKEYGKTIRCYFDMKDFFSTSNLCKHILACWGENALEAANKQANAS
ncbi:hypothetical protein OBBRIDRAFT_715153, partial [Obba rivulosa]